MAQFQNLNYLVSQALIGGFGAFDDDLIHDFLLFKISRIYKYCFQLFNDFYKLHMGTKYPKYSFHSQTSYTIACNLIGIFNSSLSDFEQRLIDK